MWYTGVLPLGGDHISNDIAVGLRTPTSDAEELKKRHGCALTALVREDETVDVPSVGGRKARQLSRQILSEIIQPRVEEIFTLVARDLGRAGLEDVAAAGVVLTGGTSILQGVPELAEQIFDVPVRRGRADRHRRARRRGAEPDLRHRRRARALRRPRPRRRGRRRSERRIARAARRPADEGVGR